jgi:NAD(P)-dependent dehydrogenase (short-subunit alcohol dehydrogenase family)
MDFGGKVAVVTGASRGIGRGIAERLAQAGCRVVVNSRDPTRARQVAEEFVAAGFKAMPVAADVSRVGEARRLVEATVEACGRLDIWVNNAGAWSARASLEVEEEEWDTLIDLNLKAAFFCSRFAATAMLANGGGTILNIASIIGPVAIPRRAAYGAAKAGLIALTRILAVEWAGRGIRVNALAPGFIETGGAGTGTAAPDYSDADIVRRTPVGRWGRVRDVAEAALFLCSTAAEFIVGETLFVDGGWQAYGGW